MINNEENDNDNDNNNNNNERWPTSNKSSSNNGVMKP